MTATTEATPPHQFDEINVPVPVPNPDNSLTTKIPYIIYIVFHRKKLIEIHQKVNTLVRSRVNYSYKLNFINKRFILTINILVYKGKIIANAIERIYLMQ
ncbi:hypothetical protein GE278_19205 [Enterobacteriaceae bacterium Kacie_13]|nr:hypothetical protein GE278_19205 [Enterobacteriaceae bacterium Kacie_13]